MKKAIFAILDGIGVKKEEFGNAFKLASTPNIDNLLLKYPHSLLSASGEYVGLPENQMGNSEVGHITIGSGRIVDQPLKIINESIENGSFYKNEEFLKAIEHAKKNNSKLHILGLLSDGGIHSHINHIFSLIKLAKINGINKLYIHVFLDGRDTLPDVSLTYLNELSDLLNIEQIGEIATISGRYYSMDREGMWNKVKLAYDVIVNNFGPYCESYEKVIQDSYSLTDYDEFVVPTIINKNGVIEDNDALILANFRPDRVTELFKAITNPLFNDFEVKKLNNIKLVTMMPVSEEIISTPAFSHITINNTLGEVLSNNNYRVLRIAEKSKFPHVTHFFDGDRDLELKNTVKICVPRKEVDTYDLYPPMSASLVTDEIIRNINNFDFIVVNYANGDILGHTGNLKAAIEGIEIIDKCIGKLYEVALNNNFTLILGADHGNCEEMLDKDNNPLTTHTNNPVNFIVCNNKYNLENGGLSNIAPSILSILELPIPNEMTSKVIIKDISDLVLENEKNN